MTIDNLQEGSEVTPEAFADLQKRLAKAEKKLAKAKSRAQATMQEIWQLDVKLKEEEERANVAEAKLTDLGSGVPVEGAADSEELAQLRHDLEQALEDASGIAELREEIEVLRDELRNARQAAIQVEELTQERDSLLEKVQYLAELSQSAPEADPQELQDLKDRLAVLSHERETLGAHVRELEQQLESGAAAPDEDSLKALREAEEMVASLQARLEQDGGGGEVSDTRLEFLESRLSGTRIALHEAEERARLAEDKISTVGSSTGVFEDQLVEIQAKVKEAEERALEWEERFHASEERASRAEDGGGDSQELVMEFQDRISELETELAEIQQGETVGDTAELGELRDELEQAKRRADRAEKRADDMVSQSDDEALLQMKERLQLSEERGELLKAKAEQAGEKLQLSDSKMDDLKSQAHQLETDLGAARAEVDQLKAQAGQAAQIGLAAGATETRLQEALQRARDAELKANQFEIQLQKTVASLSDYEQRANESDRETQRLAFQDCLTGLPNLNLIRQYLEFTVKQVQRYNRASALLVVDLDRFKLINDAMGFKAGDELLGKVAERLQTAIRESDALGRKGEDEFLILLSELITGDDDTPSEQKTNMIRKNIAIVVNRISECLSRPFTIQGQKFYIRASIGVSICPNDADSSQSMLEHADSAMYHAKETGRGRCVFYNNELHKRQERRLAMDSQLRLAMEKGEFVLQYQPIIEVTKKVGRVVGVEALLRWNHRIDGLLEPASFLGIAEETGLIVQLGQWVCRQTCWQLRQWMSEGHQLFASFNVSTRQMLQADLPEMILGSVEEFGLPPGLVFVELSEGANVEEVDLTERVVANLGRAGIKVAVDDFGVGYSSISRMDLNHIQFLKIDPSLVRAPQDDKAKTNICEAAVNLAHSLELLSIAEGVETLQQAKFMLKSGCHYMQGYHFCHPIDAAKITKMLEEKTTWKI
jgi:diguanylate cyclase (GGDEF)-like protein